jgi:hypothetical protein
MLKGMALEAALGVFAVVPSHGIKERTRVGPVACETENFGIIRILRIARGMLRLGHFAR